MGYSQWDHRRVGHNWTSERPQQWDLGDFERQPGKSHTGFCEGRGSEERLGEEVRPAPGEGSESRGPSARERRARRRQRRRVVTGTPVSTLYAALHTMWGQQRPTALSGTFMKTRDTDEKWSIFCHSKKQGHHSWPGSGPPCGNF